MHTILLQNFKHNMIYYLIYFLFSPILFLIIYIGSLFNKKIFKHLKNENRLFKKVIKKIKNIDRTKIKVLIFHAASAGEFEQLKPILKNIDKDKYFIIQTFTSPTIYEKEKNNVFFNISCYHPYDLWWKSVTFFSRIKPDIYIITRHDLWPGHILMASIVKSKIFYINANIHLKSVWLNKLCRPFSQYIFRRLTKCLVPSEKIASRAKKIISKDKIIITGDTRFDQIIDRYEMNKNKKYLPDNFLDTFNIIFGSYDNYDEKIIIDSLASCYPKGSDSLKKLNHKVILVPHEIEKNNLNAMIKKLQTNFFKPILFSNIKKSNDIYNLIIIDKVGILADLYKYATLAYVGSGFGRGVHSVIEPGVYGCVVSFGPNIEMLDEAKYIYKENLGVMIKTSNEMNDFLKLYQTKDKIDKLSKKIKNYILTNKNISENVFEIIKNS